MNSDAYKPTQSNTMKTDVDVIIVGGGIAGLFTLAKLIHHGYQAVLLEKDALGCAQTIASQGIIHSGVKYALKGNSNNAQKSIAEMPDYWLACLNGKADIDLSAAKILTKTQLMWGRRLSEKVTGFFASHLMRSHVKSINHEHLPKALSHTDCRGNFYALNEPVLDIESLLAAFAKTYQHAILTKAVVTQVQGKENHKQILYTHDGVEKTLTAKLAILTAGENNLDFLDTGAAKMQKRPVHMVKVKVPNDYGDLFCHVLGLSDKPRLTISSYRRYESELIWYLGGQLAEDGVNLTSPAQIKEAQRLLQELFPWLSIENIPEKDYTSFLINRAEGSNAGLRPEGPSIKKVSAGYVAWPTKLVMAPMLAEQLLFSVKKEIPKSSSLEPAFWHADHHKVDIAKF